MNDFSTRPWVNNSKIFPAQMGSTNRFGNNETTEDLVVKFRPFLTKFDKIYWAIETVKYDIRDHFHRFATLETYQIQKINLFTSQ